ncbi:MAG: hypothetical protein QMD92_08010 [bacterium]|nr:hypothetical protein [bacterium]
MENEIPKEHFLEVFERRNKAFRILYNTVIEIEETEDENIFPIFCRNLQKICNAKRVFLASYNSNLKTLTLKSIYDREEKYGLFIKEYSKYTLKMSEDLINGLQKTQIIDNVEQCKYLLDFFFSFIVEKKKLMGKTKCYYLSCIRKNELVAVIMIQL